MMPLKQQPSRPAVLLRCKAAAYRWSTPLRAIHDFIDETGQKSMWLDNLSFSSDLLAAKSAERVTLPEVVESDYLTRASALLLAYGQVDRVFWAYQPEAGQPAAIALQSYANLAYSLSTNAGGDGLSCGNEFEVLRFRSSRQAVHSDLACTGRR